MSYRNILIVKLSAIGDVIHALPVASALKKCFPQARITWVVEKPAFDILNNNPDIDEIIIFEKPKFKSVTGFIQNAPAFIQLLRSKKFDLALDLQGLFKSGIIGLLSGAPKRYVYCNTREGSDLLSKKICGPNVAGHIVEQYLDVVRYLGCSVSKAEFGIVITDAEKAQAEEAAALAGLDFSKRYVVLASGANWPNKRWPVDSFAVLADKLSDAEITPVLIGAPSDRQLNENILSSAKWNIVDITGKTSLKQLAYIISQSAALVGGDTGPMHLAAALDIPVAALMGPTNIERNGPYAQEYNSLIAERDCYGCWKRSCPKGLDCLDAISVDAVFNKVMSIAKLG